MSLLARILPPGNVLCGLDVGSKAQLFEEAGWLFENNLQLPRKKVIGSLATREKLGSTGLGYGIAIPHGRIKGLREATGAFFRLKTPISFDAPDGQPVGMLFILLVPEQATDLHLQILGELAQMFSNRQLREKLQASSDPVETYRLLTTWS
ncbi:PTS sugar transporter subunit IIA [Sulfuricella sp.]|uniref:PTS sugar transporter subunit IIA n=1 Tax=Sulfuricella sp. TaxID=2099377 RepID=UPI002BCC8D0B|nr:PTS sugar transporter subunit IIA [Sulfuricella sp.]HUX63410.1 PTS sugar transporter subunit IIA [Sulfuricella sp.]